MQTYYPSKEEFFKLTETKKGNVIPVYREILGDLETPVSAYFKIAEGAKYSFLLESVEGEEKVARFSFLARDPELVFRCKNNRVEIIHFIDVNPSQKTNVNTDYNTASGKEKVSKNGNETRESHDVRDTPLTFIRELMGKFRLITIEGLPRFCGVLIGYMGYDVVRFFEKLPAKPSDDLNLPDMLLILAKNLIIFDHRVHKMKLVSCVEFDPSSSVEEKKKQYDRGIEAIDRLEEELNRPLNRSSFSGEVTKELEVQSNVSQAEFLNMVKAAKKKIKAGDIIQVVLSQRFQMPVETNPFNIYRTLRTLNPSPYMYFLNFDGLQIIGSSPELLVRCEDGVVETRPIAGTRRRGKNEKEDQLLQKDLLNDPKEKAEHVMLVDLGRNDLGRVCQKGSVQISEFMGIEKYSHVMHIVSNVKGRLQKGKDSCDVLQAAFPAGTVSGAPKIRAMEIIDELENVSRGPYAGAIGYFSFSGNLDSCITIRTIVVTKGKAYIQAGAGIVADSVPQKEYAETINKAKAQIMAIKLAHHQAM